MQKLFIVKETLPDEDDSGLQAVNLFIGTQGKIISATAFGLAASNPGGQSSVGPGRQAGRILVVADDGKGENVSL